MGYKLHRSRRSVFGRRRPWGKIIMVLLAVAFVAAGFFLALWLDKPDGSRPETESSPTDTSHLSTEEPDQPTSQPADTKPVTAAIRGFTLPHKTLMNSEALAATLERATAGGLNTLIFDLKDANGTLFYRFTGAQATKVNSYAADALTADQLKELLATARKAGVQVVPRLYAFQDHEAARVLAAARISPDGNPGWVWYDGNPQKGGRAWLNPYADEAHLYILSLCEELKEAGVDGVMLDGVQFPAYTGSASFGTSSNTTLSRNEMLTAFVTKVRQTLGEECPVMLASDGKAALGVDTGIYGGNPLTFGATQAVPRIALDTMPSSVTIGEAKIAISDEEPASSMKAVVKHMDLRLKVAGQDTTLTPWIVADDLTPQALADCLVGCRDGGTESFILHRADGTYDFKALG